MLTLSGAPALSDFRTARLLTALRSRVPAVESITTRYTHFVQTGRELTGDERRVLDALMARGAPHGLADECRLVAPRGHAVSARGQLVDAHTHTFVDRREGQHDQREDSRRRKRLLDSSRPDLYSALKSPSCSFASFVDPF